MRNINVRRFPNLFIAGVQKAGTTSLFASLARHPAVFGPENTKDFPFFAEEKLFRKGIDSYARLFQNNGGRKYIMTGSVHLVFFASAMHRFKECCPDARVLIMVRNPIARAVSAYRFAVQRGLERRDFDDAIRQELSCPDIDKMYASTLDRFQKFYVARGEYGAQLNVVYKLFSPGQVFIGVFEDMKDEPGAFMKGLLSWLDLDPIALDVSETNVTAGLPRSQALAWLMYNQAIRDSWIVEHLKKLAPHHVRYRIRRWLYALNTDQKRVPLAQVSADTEEELRLHYLRDLERYDNQLQADQWRHRWGLHA